MKTVNKICQILAIVFGVTSLVFFFTNFVTIVSSEDTVLTGAQLAFGGKFEFAGMELGIYKSAKIWFCLMLNIFGVLFSALTFKFKGTRWAAPAVSIVSAIFMLVIALGSPWSYVDSQPIDKYAAVQSINFHYSIWVVIAALFLATAFGIAHLLLADKLEAGSKKPTIPQRVVAFCRDYKSEVKKIVWPNFKSVVKNTIVVLVLCALLGVFVWLLDWGLGALLGLILGL